MDAFSNCNNLEKVTLSDSITEIPVRCFFGCASLVNINTPTKLKKIGRGAFNGCSSLRDFRFPENIEFEGGAFSNTKIDSIQYPIIIEGHDSEMISSKQYFRSNKGFIYYTVIDEKMAIQHMEDIKGTFSNTPFEKRLEQSLQIIKKERMEKKVCMHCGGEFKGIFVRVCSLCQREKDY